MPVLPRRLVAGAHPIPELDSDDGSPALLEEEHLEAVLQLMLHHLVEEVGALLGPQILRQAQADGQQESHQEEAAGGRDGGLGPTAAVIWKTG